MANSSIVGTLRALLTLDTAQFDAAAKRVGDSAKTFEKDFKAVGREATQLGSALTKTLTLPLLGIGVGAAKLAMDFESSFANVRKTVDASDVELAGLAMTFRNMAKEIPATTTELNKIAALGGQMGVPVQQLAEFTKNVAALGVAVDGISTEDAAAGLAQIGNVTGEGTTKIAEMASALVHLGNKSNATEADILEFTKRLIGAGNSVGMTVPEVMALGTAMANVGINAEAGGTAMSTVITKISVAVSEGGEKLKEFAKVADMSATEFAATFKRSPIEAIDLFIKGLSNMKGRGVDLNLTMGEIGTEGIRVADTLKRLAGAGDGVSKSLVIANEGFRTGNKHLEEAEKKYATTANQLQLLWNRIKDVGITIGNALLPAIQSAIGLANALLPAVKFLGDAFAAMPGPIQLGVVAVGLMVAAAGPLIYLFGQLAIAASALAGAFTAQGLAARTMAASNLTLAGTLGTLQMAAVAAAGAFAGWQVGRLIAEVLGLDKAIAEAVTRTDELTKSRQRAGGELATTATLINLVTEAEKRLATAVLERDYAEMQQARTSLNAIKTDSTRLAMLDTIRFAVDKGAKFTITYGEAIKFLAGENAKVTDKEKEKKKALDEAVVATEEARKKAEAYRKEIAGIADVFTNRAIAAETRKFNDALIQVRLTGGATGEGLKAMVARVKELAESGGFPTLTAEARRLWAEHVSLADIVPKVERGMGDVAAGLPNQVKNFLAYGQAVSDVVEGLEELRTKVTMELPDFSKIGTPAASLSPHMDDLAKKAKAAKEEFDKLTVSIDQSASAIQEIGRIVGSDLVVALGRGVSMANDLRVAMENTASKTKITVAEAVSVWGIFVAAGEAVSGENRDIWRGLNAEFSQLTQELRAAGVEAGVLAPILLRAGGNLAELMRTNDIARFTQFNAELRAVLDGLKDVEAEADKLNEVASRLGLGPAQRDAAYQSANLRKEMEALVSETNDLVAEGYDYNTVIKAQAESYAELIARAKLFGIEVPESMKPILRDFARLGIVIDEVTGKSIDALKGRLAALDSELTSLQNSVANEAPEEVMGVIEAAARARIAEIEKEKETISGQIDDLMLKLTDAFALAARDAIQTFGAEFAGYQLTIPVVFELPEGGFPMPPFPTMPGFEWPDMPDIPNLDTGTGGAYPNWGPGGTIVRLHDRERVSTLGEGRAEAGQMGSLLDRFDRFADQQARMPSELARAVRAAIQLA